MAFLESDRVQIRHLVGAGSLWLQAYPMLENAITAVQAVADGGTRPDASTETLIKSLITDAQTIEGRLRIVWKRADVSSADGNDGVQLDAARGTLMLRMEGRRVSGAIARLLGMNGVLGDIWAGVPVMPPQQAFGR